MPVITQHPEPASGIEGGTATFTAAASAGGLSGYAFRLTEDSVNFDGSTIVFSTMAIINGPGGVYRATTDG